MKSRNVMRAARLAGITVTRKVTIGREGFRARTVHLDVLAAASTRTDGYEHGMTVLFRRILSQRQGAFVDVGANIGQTLLNVLSIDASRRYVGIEPQSSCSADLQRFIRINDLDRCDVVTCGLSDRTGLAVLNYERANDARASLVAEFRPRDLLTRKTVIPVVTGDELLAALDVGDVALIKIDVEGGELEVLRGFQETLARRRPVLTVEVLPNLLVSTGAPLDAATKQVRADRFAAMLALLDGVDYSIALIGADGGLEPASAFLPDPGGTVRNYVAFATEAPVPG
jgi:FkbM family methyltransferase